MRRPDLVQDQTEPGSDAHVARPVRWCVNLRQVAQDVLQDAPVLEIVQFVERIDAANQRNTLQSAVGRDDFGEHALARFDLAMQPADGNLLVTPETKRLPGGSFLEAQWEDAHPDQVR